MVAKVKDIFFFTFDVKKNLDEFKAIPISIGLAQFLPVTKKKRKNYKKHFKLKER